MVSVNINGLSWCVGDEDGVSYIVLYSLLYYLFIFPVNVLLLFPVNVLLLLPVNVLLLLPVLVLYFIINNKLINVKVCNINFVLQILICVMSVRLFLLSVRSSFRRFIPLSVSLCISLFACPPILSGHM